MALFKVRAKVVMDLVIDIEDRNAAQQWANEVLPDLIGLRSGEHHLLLDSRIFALDQKVETTKPTKWKPPMYDEVKK
jgi:hypothetical protein